MKAATAVKGISRIVVLLHPGQLQNGIVLSLAQTDFDVSDEQLDEWKRRFIEGGGACIYDGPPANDGSERPCGRKEDACSHG